MRVAGSTLSQGAQEEAYLHAKNDRRAGSAALPSRAGSIGLDFTDREGSVAVSTQEQQHVSLQRFGIRTTA
jgi:hypothetical protein